MAESGWELRRRQWELTIEKVAMELFIAEGVDAVTVRRIAEAADISERTFYRYFPNKEDIFWARPRRFVSVLPTVLANRPAEESLLDAFRHAGRQVLSEFTDEPEGTMAWAQVVRNTAPSVTRIIVGDGNPYYVALSSAVSRRLGGLNSLEAGVLTFALTGTIQFALGEWLDSDGRSDLTVLFEDAVDALVLLQRSMPSGVRPLASPAETAALPEVEVLTARS